MGLEGGCELYKHLKDIPGVIPDNEQEYAQNANIVNFEQLAKAFKSKNLKIYPILITGVNVNTEIAQALSENTKRFIMQVHGTDGENKVAGLRVSFVENGTLNTGAKAREYMLVPPGGFLDLDEFDLENYSIYFQCDKSDRVVKILEYT